MDTGRIFAQKSYSGARSRLCGSLKKFSFVFLSFPPSSPHSLPHSNEICKTRNAHTGRMKYLLLHKIISGQLSSNCEVSADISVQVCSLRPQTSQPSRFLKDHQACESLSLINQQLPSHFLGVESALRSLMWPSYLKHKKQTKKKIAAQHKLRVSDDSHSPCLLILQGAMI